MARSEQLTAGLRVLSTFLVGEADVQQTLTRVAHLATDASPAAFAGLTLETQRGPRTSVFTDAEAPEIDQAQYDTGRGPCLSSMRTGEINRIDDTADDRRWPEFSRAARAHGIGSTLSPPLVVPDHEPAGALNLYAREEHAFDEAAEAEAQAFAEQAAAVLLNTQAYWDKSELSEQLQQALQSRAAIEQAKGIMMAREGCSPEEAFQILVRASQRTNAKLRDIATDIVARAQRDHPPSAENCVRPVQRG
jgi:GAF domain-containing protein